MRPLFLPFSLIVTIQQAIHDGDWYAATKGADNQNKHRLEIETICQMRDDYAIVTGQLSVPSLEGCQDIEVAKIHPFENHPFKVLDDDKMHELVESIMMNGVLTHIASKYFFAYN